MWTRAQLKANAKYALRGRYGKCLLASLAVEAIPLLYSLITTIAMLVVVIPFTLKFLPTRMWWSRSNGCGTCSSPCRT